MSLIASAIPPEDLVKIAIGTFVGIAALGIEKIAKKQEKKAEKEVDEEEILEVVTKKELDELVEKVELLEENQEKTKKSFEDSVACYTIIQILLEPLKYDKRNTLEVTCNQVFAFLRHADFPSKEIVQTFMEMALQQKKEIKENDTLDTRTDH